MSLKNLLNINISNLLILLLLQLKTTKLCLKAKRPIQYLECAEVAQKRNLNLLPEGSLILSKDFLFI